MEKEMHITSVLRRVDATVSSVIYALKSNFK